MTAYERTGWRDQEISGRHRKWGFNCPAVDLDFLMVEYNLGYPVGLVEYKRYTAQQPNLKHPTYRALKKLADLAEIPFFIAFYYPDIWAFKITTVNEYSKKYYDDKTYTERQYVKILYEIRSRRIEESVFNRLNNSLPKERNKAYYNRNSKNVNSLFDF